MALQSTWYGILLEQEITLKASTVQAARNRSSAEEAIKSIFNDTGKSPIFLELDLADLDSVQTAAQLFLE
jgi:retinol dehydrogenase-12